jgi:hypothetical protein
MNQSRLVGRRRSLLKITLSEEMMFVLAREPASDSVSPFQPPVMPACWELSQATIFARNG